LVFDFALLDFFFGDFFLAVDFLADDFLAPFFFGDRLEALAPFFFFAIANGSFVVSAQITEKVCPPGR
jgi:hypothetical protein